MPRISILWRLESKMSIKNHRKEKDVTMEKKNLIWNMIGSLIYAVTSMMIGMTVIKIAGAFYGGIFFFAFTTLGQQFFILAYFGVRPVQIMDIGYEYSFGEYRCLRFMTVFSSIVLGTLYCILFAKDIYSMLIWALMILYKAIDALADVYESEYQRVGSLYIGGRVLALRTVVSVTCFIFTLVLTRDLLLSSIVFVFALSLIVWLFDVRDLKRRFCPDYSWRFEKVKGLFHSTKWLFVSTFLDLYIFAAVKYAVNTHLGEVYNSYFSTIFIPTSIINLMAGFVIRPTLGKLALFFERGEKKAFHQTILKLIVMVGAITCISILGSNYIGIHILAFLLGGEGKNIVEYKDILLILILGGGFYAVVNILYYCLIILHKEKSIFFLYSVGAVLAFFLSEHMVGNYGMTGAGYGYLMLMILLTLAFAVIYTIFAGKEWRSVVERT